jgi:hypothetical protein
VIAAPSPDFSHCRGMMAKGIVVPKVFRAAANTGCIRKARKAFGAARIEPAPARV